MTQTLLIRNVRPWGAAPTDMLIRDGRITRIASGIAAEGAPVEDGGGAIALPGLVEAHTHLDKSLLGMGWRPHQAGPSLMDKIETERRLKNEWDIDPAADYYWIEFDVETDEQEFNYTIPMPPGTSEFTLPASLLLPGAFVAAGVAAIGENGNATVMIVEVDIEP